MSLFLDSAHASDAREAMAWGFVSGITTNPSLMAQTGRKSLDVIAELTEICPGPVFYQLAGASLDAREAEARRFLALRPNVALKIAMTPENLGMAARLAREGAKVGMTACYSAAQTYMCCEAQTAYSIAYVNRSTRLQGDGLSLVEEMRAVADACGSSTRIMVASLKSTREVVQAILAGAQDVTIPLPLLREMGSHPLSEQTIDEFAKAAAQLPDAMEAKHER